MMENPWGDEWKKALNFVLKDTWKHVPVPAVQASQPVRYQEGDPKHILTGVPLTLQPEVSMVQVGHHSSQYGSAPYDVTTVKHVPVILHDCLLPAPLSFQVIC